MIEQAKFAYSPLGKSFEKQKKNIQLNTEKKQVQALEVLDPEKNQKLKPIEGLFPKEMRNDEAKNDIDKIKKWKNKIKRKNLKYKTNRSKYDLQQFKTRSFGDSIYNDKVGINEADMDQTKLLDNMVDFNNNSRARSKEDKDKKRNTFDSVGALYEGWELILNAFRSGIFPIKATKGKGSTLDLATRLKY